MFDFLKEPKVNMVTVRPCSCGSESFFSSNFYDAYICRGCGLVYFCGPEVKNPVMERRQEGLTPPPNL